MKVIYERSIIELIEEQRNQAKKNNRKIKEIQLTNEEFGPLHDVIYPVGCVRYSCNSDYNYSCNEIYYEDIKCTNILN